MRNDCQRMAVLDEIDCTLLTVLQERGDIPNKLEAIDLTRSLPLLPTSDEIPEIVQSYIQNKLMPADPAGDALHLAFASFYKCDFLLTWNCKHFGQRKQVRAY